MTKTKISCETHKNKNLKNFSGYPNNLKICKKCLLIFRNKNTQQRFKNVIALKKFNDIRRFDSLSNKVENDIIFLDKLLKILNVTKKIYALDYGCGYGSFLKALQIKKINGYGFDINEFFYKNLRKKFNMFRKKKDIEYFNKKFDIIFLRKVLNLSPNPVQDFLFFKKKLNIGGHIVILDHVTEFSQFSYEGLFFNKKANNTHLLTSKSLIKIAKSFNFIPVYNKNIFGSLQLILKNKNDKIREINAEDNLLLYKIKIKTHLYLSFIFILFNFIFTFFYRIYRFFKI